MMIPILQLPNAAGVRLPGEAEEVDLLRLDAVFDNDDERAVVVEFCLKGCEGPAHSTGVPDAPSHFCNLHVHRSVHVTKKKWPDALQGAVQSFV